MTFLANSEMSFRHYLDYLHFNTECKLNTMTGWLSLNLLTVASNLSYRKIIPPWKD